MPRSTYSPIGGGGPGAAPGGGGTESVMSSRVGLVTVSSHCGLWRHETALGEPPAVISTQADLAAMRTLVRGRVMGKVWGRA